MGAEEILTSLRESGNYLVVAESLTGGLLTAEFAKVPGASEVLLAGVVAYDTQLKHSLLGVSSALLESNGPVNAEVAIQMAIGLREKIASAKGIETSKIVGIATTGVAGPTEQNGHPVGELFIAVSWGAKTRPISNVYQHSLAGSRTEIQETAVSLTLSHLLEEIRG